MESMNDCGVGLKNMVDDACVSYWMDRAATPATLLRVSKALDKAADGIRARADALSRQAKIGAMQDKQKGFGKVAKAIDTRFAKPLAHVKRTEQGPNGEPSGTYATKPKEIDFIIRKAWGKQIKGNLDNPHKAAAKFIEMYAQYIPKSPEIEVLPITGRLLFEVCVKATKSVAGPDGFEPAEMALLSMKAFGHMADLLNLIERGAPWHEGMSAGRVAFLEKDEGSAEDPMKFRLLTILNSLYRRWASARLESLRPWIETWAIDSIFAGAVPQGAPDAVYHLAIQMEYSTLIGENYVVVLLTSQSSLIKFRGR